MQWLILIAIASLFGAKPFFNLASDNTTAHILLLCIE